jgi:hypothetical protein
MESRETELCSKLYKTEEEQQIFLGFFNLSTRTRETTNKVKSFWIFLNTKTENRRQSKPKLEN